MMVKDMLSLLFNNKTEDGGEFLALSSDSPQSPNGCAHSPRETIILSLYTYINRTNAAQV